MSEGVHKVRRQIERWRICELLAHKSEHTLTKCRTTCGLLFIKTIGLTEKINQNLRNQKC